MLGDISSNIVEIISIDVSIVYSVLPRPKYEFRFIRIIMQL